MVIINKLKGFNYEKVLEYFSYSIIIFLITGPAIPDIIATTISIFFIVKIFKEKIFNENFYLFLICFIFLLLPNLFSKYFPLAFIEQLINIRYFIFALCLASFINLRLEMIIKIMLLATLIISFDLIFQYFFKINIIGIPIDTEHNGRASSFFGDELIAGTYILKFSFPVIGYYIFKKKFLMAYFLILTYSVAIIFSGERMSFLLFGLGIVIFFFLIRDLKKIFTLTISLMFICIMSFFAFDGVKSRVDNFLVSMGFQEENIMDFGHAAHYMTAYEIFRENKITGTGHKTFRYECNNEKIIKKVNSLSPGCTTHPHNNIFEMLSDSGLIGLFGYTLLGLFIIAKSIKNNIFFSEKCGFLVSAIIIFWPISSAGNFFNNRIAITNFLIFGILLFFSNRNIFLKNYYNKN